MCEAIRYNEKGIAAQRGYCWNGWNKERKSKNTFANLQTIFRFGMTSLSGQTRTSDEIRNGPATMWVSEGLVKFHNRTGNITPWHGSFNEEPEGEPMIVVLKFDYEGRPGWANRKTAMLYKVHKVGEKEWRGYDYMGRSISLTLLRGMELCRTCRRWHIRD